MSDRYDILIVDDEPVVIDSVVKVGRAEGYRIDTAHSAMAALEKLSRNRYRMIICDVMMPEMDGFQFMQRLDKSGLETPVIMTTGFSTMQNAVQALLVGAAGFLPKPFTMDELVSRMKRGLKYTELLTGVRAGTVDPDKVFRRCPRRFRRLGNASWALMEDSGVVVLGVVDLFLKTIDDLQGIDLMAMDDTLNQGGVCARLETGDHLVHNLLAPLSGKIIARNEAVLDDIGLVAEDPYGNGWLYQIIPSSLEEELKMLKPGRAG